MRPYDAKTDNQLCAMRRDNLSAGDFWILNAGDHVTMAAQKVGAKATESVSIPKREFNRLIGWYMRHQKPRKRR